MDDQNEELIPKGAKMSKNIGRDTPSAMFSKPKNNDNSNLSFSSRQHHLHRPIEKYFSDKEEEKLKKDEEVRKEKLKEKTIEESMINELHKIRELIKIEKNKIKFCFLCKKKFGNSNHLNNHEKYSENHKNNQNKKKLKKN